MTQFNGLLSRFMPESRPKPSQQHHTTPLKESKSPSIVQRFFQSTGAVAYAQGWNNYAPPPPQQGSVFMTAGAHPPQGSQNPRNQPVRFIPYGSYMESMHHFFGFTPRFVPIQREQFWAPWAVTGVFGLITLLSHFEPFHSWIYQNFALSYRNRRNPIPYIASAFTHFTLPHLAFNSIAMNSFSANAGGITNGYFLALFTGLALGSSVFSMMITSACRQILRAARRPYTNLMIPSVGASGVVTGMVSISAISDPTSQVGIILLPFSFNIINALYTMIALDTAGLIASCMGKNTKLSHSGHLGGYLSGFLVAYYYKTKYNSHFREDTFIGFRNWIEVTAKLSNDDILAANRGVQVRK